ncbi:MAG: hypothetical protein LC769_06710 [Chloroflexi bacterium]|nr:hypothetical protein [Chloroflexota bacterium]
MRRVVESYPDEPRVTVTDKLASYGPASKSVCVKVRRRAPVV